MNKTLKYSSIISILLINIIIGIFAIISASETATNLTYLFNSVVKFNIYIYIIITITIIISIVSILLFFVLQKRNNKINNIIQYIFLLLNIILFAITLIVYLIINNACHFEYVVGEFYEFEQLPFQMKNSQIDNFIIAIFYNKSLTFILLFSIMSTLLQTVLTICSTTRTNEHSNIQNAQTNTTTNTSPNSIIKQEIEEMKQALELKSLKEEYAKLYTELNKSSDKQ